MTRRLILLRHGQTDWNASRRMQGQQNSQLDAIGLAQAAAVAPAIAALKPERLWASDLDRAIRTAAIVGETFGATPKLDARLREYSLGALEGMTHDEFQAHDADGFAVFRAAQWADVPEIEPPTQVAKRFVACIEELASSLSDTGVGVAVAHGACIRTGVVALLGWEPRIAQELGPLANCAWVELAEREDAGWSLVAYNRTA